MTSNQNPGVAASCTQQLISLLKLASYKQLGAGAALY